MARSKSINKSRPRQKSPRRSRRARSIAELRLKYCFFVLMGDLVLSAFAMALRIETPVVWTFLYSIGGWAALTSNKIMKTL